MATEAWVTVTESTMVHYLVAAQFEALQTSALGSSQGDPFDQVMPDVVRMVRQYIEACPQNRLSGTANSIPSSLVADTCWLIAEAMQRRIPGFKLTESQLKAADVARERLKMVSRCELPIAQPSDAVEPVVSAATATVVSYTTRKATPALLDGL